MQGASSFLSGRPDLVWALEAAGHQPAEEKVQRADGTGYWWDLYCYKCGLRYYRTLHFLFGLSPRRPCEASELPAE